jgi:hypothetical protein
MKEVTLPDFLTQQQIDHALQLYSANQGKERHRVIRDSVIAPAMEEINRKLGQENDPDYLTYMVEYVFGAASK